MERGWVKLWRKLLDSEIFQNEGLLKVAVWALLKANHKEAWVPLKTGRGKTTVHLKPGQFIFGRRTAAKELKMPASSARNRFSALERLQFLNLHVDHQHTVGTVINWESYQPETMESGPPKDHQKRQKKDHQTNDNSSSNSRGCQDTRQEGGPPKNDQSGHKQEVYTSGFFSVTDKQHETYREAYPTLDLMAEYKAMAAWLESNPKKRKTPRGYPRFVNNWLSKAYKEKKHSSNWRDELPDL